MSIDSKFNVVGVYVPLGTYPFKLSKISAPNRRLFIAGMQKKTNISLHGFIFKRTSWRRYFYMLVANKNTPKYRYV